MEIKRIENIKPEPTDMVTVKVAGNVIELRLAKMLGGSPIRKISRSYGVDIRSGEVVEYQHKVNRAEDKASAKQSLKRLRDIINANLERPENTIWITLTYAENMRDEKRLYADFHAFWKRFQRYQKREGQATAQYIAAAEPQGRGAWHFHLLLLFPDKAPFIPNAKMAQLWGHGFTKTKSLTGVSNPGLYLTAYLGNMELSESAISGNFRANRLTASKDKSKAVVKGARLKLYPPGFNLYRCSRGVKRPEVWQTTEREAQAEISGMPLTYEKTISVTDKGGELRNIINYRTYTKAPAESDTITTNETTNAETSRDTN